MAEAQILFSDPQQIMILFGPRDAYLRRIREVLGIDLILRGDSVVLRGDEDRIRRGEEVVRRLQRKLEFAGSLSADQVEDELNEKKQVIPPSASAIPLHEKSKKVVPRTPGQAAYVDSVMKNELVFCVGPAGCGKTYLAVALAVNALREEKVKKIVLVRPAVEAGERLGFLPGDLLAKVNPYLRPLLDALHDMLDVEQVKRYQENDVIEIVPLAFMRGRTLNHTFIILDEGQNTTPTQMKMFLTRMGQGSRIVVTGDLTQTDLPPHQVSGLNDAIERLQDIEGIGVSRLTGKDIVRHRLVREIVKAYDGPESHHSRAGRRSRPDDEPA